MQDIILQVRKKARGSAKFLWGTTTCIKINAEMNLDGQISESDCNVASMVHNLGGSTLFLSADSVFWPPTPSASFTCI